VASSAYARLQKDAASLAATATTKHVGTTYDGTAVAWVEADIHAWLNSCIAVCKRVLGLPPSPSSTYISRALSRSNDCSARKTNLVSVSLSITTWALDGKRRKACTGKHSSGYMIATSGWISNVIAILPKIQNT